MTKDRSRDDRRSVGSHEKMTASLGRVAGWKRSAGLAMNLDKKEYFAPGHGHVTTGTRGVFNPDSLMIIKDSDATKGLNK